MTVGELLRPDQKLNSTIGTGNDRRKSLADAGSNVVGLIVAVIRNERNRQGVATVAPFGFHRDEPVGDVAKAAMLPT